MKKTVALSMLILFKSGFLFAADAPLVIGEVEMPSLQTSAAFEQIKKKLGRWEGRLSQSLTGAEYDVSYEFKLISGGSTIVETVVEDGVEMMTTYTDEAGELIIKHYCALGTEPVLRVVQASDKVVELAFDDSRSSLMRNTHDFVTSMKWTIGDDADSMIYEYDANIDGELSTNIAELVRQ
tara:strand:+ start:446 stop:988 length:543 start_codon:yes stop_codon:yes gene_type:complete